MRAAGRRHQRITLQRKSISRDAYGGETVTWTDVATVWAEARTLSGREYLAARAEQSETQVQMRLDWKVGLTPGDRVLWRDVAHDIEAVLDPGGRQEEMVLMCKALN